MRLYNTISKKEAAREMASDISSMKQYNFFYLSTELRVQVVHVTL